MKYISEALSSRLICHELAFTAAAAAFIAASKQAKLFPVVIAEGHAEGSIIAFKSANTAELVGWKTGRYWPSNAAINMPCHVSTIFLLDPETGRLDAVIEGTEVNVFRTAAADGVAVAKLSRVNSECLAIFGTGHQALYECAAVANVRDITTILVVGRDKQKAQAMVETLAGKGFNAQVADAESACRRADIIVTVTSATSPLFKAEWVQSGTHISAMGADTKGKQELPVALFEIAKLYCDFTSQAMEIGEFQHLNSCVKQHQPVMLGDVLTNKAIGRNSEAEITVFDSSGIAVQDLFIGQHLLEAAEAAGCNIEL